MLIGTDVTARYRVPLWNRLVRFVGRLLFVVVLLSLLVLGVVFAGRLFFMLLPGDGVGYVGGGVPVTGLVGQSVVHGLVGLLVVLCVVYAWVLLEALVAGVWDYAERVIHSLFRRGGL